MDSFMHLLSPASCSFVAIVTEPWRNQIDRNRVNIFPLINNNTRDSFSNRRRHPSRRTPRGNRRCRVTLRPGAFRGNWDTRVTKRRTLRPEGSVVSLGSDSRADPGAVRRMSGERRVSFGRTGNGSTRITDCGIIVNMRSPRRNRCLRPKVPSAVAGPGCRSKGIQVRRRSVPAGSASCRVRRETRRRD